MTSQITNNKWLFQKNSKKNCIYFTFVCSNDVAISKRQKPDQNINRSVIIVHQSCLERVLIIQNSRTHKYMIIFTKTFSIYSTSEQIDQQLITTKIVSGIQKNIQKVIISEA
jgi:hypothetical protein